KRVLHQPRAVERGRARGTERVRVAYQLAQHGQERARGRAAPAGAGAGGRTAARCHVDHGSAGLADRPAERLDRARLRARLISAARPAVVVGGRVAQVDTKRLLQPRPALGVRNLSALVTLPDLNLKVFLVRRGRERGQLVQLLLLRLGELAHHRLPCGARGSAGGSAGSGANPGSSAGAGAAAGGSGSRGSGSGRGSGFTSGWSSWVCSSSARWSDRIA